jgi:hypothetical protein
MNSRSQQIELKPYQFGSLVETSFKSFNHYRVIDISDHSKRTFQLPESDHMIDFIDIIQYHKHDNRKKRLIGRFVGDPVKTINTLKS